MQNIHRGNVAREGGGEEESEQNTTRAFIVSDYAEKEEEKLGTLLSTVQIYLNII